MLRAIRPLHQGKEQHIYPPFPHLRNSHSSQKGRSVSPCFPFRFSTLTSKYPPLLRKKKHSSFPTRINKNPAKNSQIQNNNCPFCQISHKMKDDDSLPVTTSSTASSATSTAKKDSSDATLFGKGRYKFWALAAISLLAFWSMFTGTVTLRWSAGNLNHLSDDLDTPLRDDLDVLEMEEREKVVKYMWDVYTNSRRIRLPRFWQQAFEAAYEDMISDVPGVREAAITEIAKMSANSIHLDPPPIQLTGARELSLKHAEIRKTVSAAENH